MVSFGLNHHGPRVVTYSSLDNCMAWSTWFVMLVRHGLYSLAKFGMVWHGLAWFRMVWHGLEWFGMIWLGLAWFGMVWRGLA